MQAEAGAEEGWMLSADGTALVAATPGPWEHSCSQGY